MAEFKWYMVCSDMKSSTRVCTNAAHIQCVSETGTSQRQRNIHLLAVFALHTTWKETEESLPSSSFPRWSTSK